MVTPRALTTWPPLSASYSPVTSLSRDDLPAPLGPIRPTRWSCWISHDRSRKMGRAPKTRLTVLRLTTIIATLQIKKPQFGLRLLRTKVVRLRPGSRRNPRGRAADVAGHANLKVCLSESRNVNHRGEIIPHSADQSLPAIVARPAAGPQSQNGRPRTRWQIDCRST